MSKPLKRELEIVFNELFENKKNIFMDLMKMVYGDKHNFLFLNIPSQRMFKNWNELIIDDESDNEEIEIK